MTAARSRNSVDKADLLHERDRLRDIGRRMANLCFNWSQWRDKFSESERRTMAGLAKQWDVIKPAERVKAERDTK